MNIKNIMRKKARTKMVGISIKIPVSASVFMKKENFSPTGIFHEALIDLGWKPESTEKNKEGK